ncbi:Hypothetical predicted protein [Olea europaea subsp. europaea]|uniref:Uncharacterized protein n=1 Tax=Olea europaea subsp. europaea TaxID=158383 RepID=A0A8S0UC13_OLEEU|nr:Hypothetical predicted protein [Olea europaea subsp. europaea]
MKELNTRQGQYCCSMTSPNYLINLGEANGIWDEQQVYESPLDYIMALASISSDGSLVESCYWADDEVRELMELVKQNLGNPRINQMLHNLCFTWVPSR